MKLKIVLIVFTLTLLIMLTGCVSKPLIKSIDDIILTSLDDPLSDWVQLNHDIEGIYIARDESPSKAENYYLYINKQNTNSVTISSEGDNNDSITININLLASANNPVLPSPNPFALRVTRIQTNWPVKNLIVNGEKIERSDIMIIESIDPNN